MMMGKRLDQSNMIPLQPVILYPRGQEADEVDTFWPCIVDLMSLAAQR